VRFAEGRIEIKTTSRAKGGETVVFQTTDGKGCFIRHLIRVKTGR